MFNMTKVENHNNSVRFPDNINVHEHRAPTDKSVDLLNEMEDKALDNVVLKISELRTNKFSYNVFFVNVIGFDPLSPKGVMVIKFNCNGKTYSKKIKCSSSIMSTVMKYGPYAHMIDLPMKIQTFILFEMSALIAHLLLDTDTEALVELFSHIHASDAIHFDLSTIEDELQYD